MEKMRRPNQSIKKKKPSKISLGVKQKLIERVFEHNFSIISSAKYFKMKNSAARMIINKYKQTGKIQHIQQPKKNNDKLIQNSKNSALEGPENDNPIKQEYIEKKEENNMSLGGEQIIQFLKYHIWMTFNFRFMYGVYEIL